MLCKDGEIQQITKLFKDYEWLRREICRVESELAGEELSQSKRDRLFKWVERMRLAVAFVESAEEQVSSDRERIMYRSMIEGKNGKQIAQALGVSRQYYYKARKPFLARVAATKRRGDDPTPPTPQDA